MENDMFIKVRGCLFSKLPRSGVFGTYGAGTKCELGSINISLLRSEIRVARKKAPIVRL